MKQSYRLSQVIPLSIIFSLAMGIALFSLVTSHAQGQSSQSEWADFSMLYLTEIMHDPIKGTNFTGADYEFIEFQNRGVAALDMTGVSFSDGISLTIEAGTQIPVGEFLVIAKNPAAFQERYGFSPSNALGYSGKLSNGGERVALQDADGTEIIALTYSDDAPHLQLADGGGFSLVPVDPNILPTSVHDWRVSGERFGSPNAEDKFVQVDSIPVKVNEVLAHTDLPQIDFVELYNPTDQVADISNWFITDNLEEPTKFRVPFGTQIQPQGYHVFTQDELGFAFFAEGDSAYLLAADVAGNLTGYSHGFDFGVTPNGVSIGRCTALGETGDLEDHYALQQTVSQGMLNAPPLVGPIVISEIMYASTSGDEYIELTNTSSEAYPLYDPEHVENQWQIGGIGTFTFTASTEIPAGGTLLITAIEPETFRSRYNVSSETLIQGPFGGRLSDNGEKISLQRPDAPNPNGTIPYIDADVVSYGISAPWPVVNGLNCSLERVSLEAYGDSPTNWVKSASRIGTSDAACLANSSQQPDQQTTFLPVMMALGQLRPDSCYSMESRR